MKLKEWARNVHALAREKGWWEDEENSKDPLRALVHARVLKTVPVKLNLIHDEISEASSEARQGLYDVYWAIDVPGWVEKGRVSDKVLHEEISNAGINKRATMHLTALATFFGSPKAHDLLRRAQDGEGVFTPLAFAFYEGLAKYKPEGFGIEIVDSIIRSLDLLEALGLDVEDLMNLKHEYNKTRPHRHGNKAF